mgnify:FL=1
MKNNIVVFRAKGPTNNSYFIESLRELNYNVMSYPILKVEKISNNKFAFKSDSVILTTSFYSIYYLSRLTFERNFILYTLGEASKNLARKLGFKNIIECSGDSANMFKVFINNNKSSSYKKKGALIYLGANNISFNLPAKLADLGYVVQRYKVYKTVNVKKLSNKFINLVQKKSIAWVVLLSKKGARNFYSLSNKVFSEEEFSELKFACLSKNIADVLIKKSYNKVFCNFPNVDQIKKLILNNESEYGTL